ncbi:hypothetical protein ACJRPK_15145 [Aquimarina sp. 2-A2]
MLQKLKLNLRINKKTPLIICLLDGYFKTKNAAISAAFLLL